MGFGAQPGATDEVFLAVVDDMEDQAVVAPFEVAVQVRVQPRQAQRHRVVPLAQAHVEGEAVGDALAGLQVGERLVQAVGIDPVHRLAEAVLDHEAEDQPLDVLANLDLDFQRHRLAYLDHLQRALPLVDHPYVEDRCLAGAGNRPHLAVGEHFLAHGLPLALGEQGVVVVHHFFRPPAHGHPSLLQEDRGVADGLDRRAVVGNDQQGGAGLAETADALEALVLEIGIADRQGLVDDQDVRPPGSRHAERQAHLHAAGVGAHRLLDGLADFGEGLDIRHQRLDFLDLHAQQLPGHEDVLPAGEVRVEAHAQLEQRGDPAGHADLAAGRLGGAGDHLQQGALAGAVDPDDADRFARLDGELDLAQDPVQVVARRAERHQPFEQPAPAIGILLVGLAEAGYAYLSHQSSSTISPTRWRNRRRPSAHSSSASRVIGSNEGQSGHCPWRNSCW